MLLLLTRRLPGVIILRGTHHIMLTKSIVFSLFISLSFSQCPESGPTFGFSEAAGCLWADPDEAHRFDTLDQARARCR